MPLSKTEAERLARICVGQEAALLELKEIASLWGGMGRIYLVTASTTRPGGRGEVVVKHIDHTSRACRLPTSDKRKVIESYENEAKFFDSFSEELRLQHGIALPKALHVEAGPQTTVTCMSYLQPIPESTSRRDRLCLALDWLAAFHAATWHREELPLGSFWHYDTRPNAWKTLSGSGWEGRLKQAAKPIDEWLKTGSSLRCWIHGDFKEDNVLWDGCGVAACDFQYVGQGCPCKDLAYFLCSSGVSPEEQASLVDAYFRVLSSKLPVERKEINVGLELALCDYARCLCYSAHAPGQKQQKEWITPRVQRTMDRIDDGMDLGTEDAYRGAIQQFASNYRTD